MSGTPLSDPLAIQSAPMHEQLAELTTRRHVLIGLAMAGAVGLTQLRMPQVTAPRIDREAFLKMIPNNVGPWRFSTASGVVLPPPDALSDRLYDNLVSRVYQMPDGPAIMFVSAYNNVQDGVLQVHRPEVCYPAGGYKLTPTRSTIVRAGGRDIPSSFFTAKGYDRTEQVLYWTRVGQAFPQRWINQRLDVMSAQLAGYIPDGLLLRVSMIGDDAAAGERVLDHFLQSFVAAAGAPLRKILLG